VIWYSLEPKNVNDFMSFVRYRKGVSSANLDGHTMVTNTLHFGPKPELSNAWIARGDIDIEEILRVILKSVGSECSSGDHSGSIDHRKHHRNLVSRHYKHVDDENT
jgi:hypothetical protein